MGGLEGGRKEGREGRQADNNDDDRCGIKTGWWEGLGMRLHKIYRNFMEMRPDSSEEIFTAFIFVELMREAL